MGSSCDWSREKFTLDDDIVKTVYDTFDKLKKYGYSNIITKKRAYLDLSNQSSVFSFLKKKKTKVNN